LSNRNLNAKFRQSAYFIEVEPGQMAQIIGIMGPGEEATAADVQIAAT
jgi:hypothetical protein